MIKTGQQTVQFFNISSGAMQRKQTLGFQWLRKWTFW